MSAFVYFMPKESNFFTLNRFLPHSQSIRCTPRCRKSRAPASRHLIDFRSALRESSKLQKEHTFGHGERLVDSATYAYPMYCRIDCAPLANRMQGLT